MRFGINSISIRDFKSYYGEVSFDFPNTPGLYYLTGHNSFNDRLGANGCGKSSLIDAIDWCLYGKTSRGLRAGDVVSWGRKSCQVEVAFQLGEAEVKISRSQNPNAITINGKSSSQDDVLKVIRLNQDAFNASVILPQFGESFFELTPSRKLELLSQVMDLDFWLAKSKQAQVKAHSLAEVISKVENDISMMTGKLSGSSGVIKNLKKRSAEFEDEKLASIAALKEKAEKASAEAEKLKKLLSKKAKRVEKATKELDDIKAGYLEMRNDIRKAENETVELKAELRSAENQLRQLEAVSKEIEEAKGATCSECGQVIDAKHVDREQRKLKKDASRLAAVCEKISSQTSKQKRILDSLRKDFDDADTLYRELQKDINTLESDYRSDKRRASDAEARANEALASVKKLEKKANPFDGMIADVKAERRELKTLIAEAEAELAAVQAEHQATVYWVSGFKRVRLFVLENAIAGLEMEVNNLLMNLGLVGWSIKLDVERETKTGGVAKGFHVMVHSPKHKKPVKLEAWSGGEVQRLKLAGDLGLSNLIMEQAGWTSAIEFIDEPSEHMSSEGIEDLIETLHDRAHQTGKCVWLADHHTVQFGEFSGVLTAKMNSKGHTTLKFGARKDVD